MQIGCSEWYLQYEYNLHGVGRGFNAKRILRMLPHAEAIDLTLELPFQSYSRSGLFLLASNGLQRPWPAIELATLALLEAERRLLRKPSDVRRKVFERIREDFESHEIEPIWWLEAARRAIKPLGDAFQTNKGGASIYFILTDSNVKEGKNGVYVGSTTMTKLDKFESRQAARIAQHFTGVKSSKVARERGVEPLWSLNCFLSHVAASRRDEAESEAHRALEACGLRVFGDIPDNAIRR